MLLYHTPDRVAQLFSSATFHMSREEKKLYLTFDDGPHPEITPWVMDQLKQYNARGTFFCVGENLAQRREFINRFEDGGHALGNHTFNHLNGWNTKLEEYLLNVDKSQEVFEASMFRPPYGKIGRNQMKKLSESMRIYMWDVLTGDFDKNLSKESCWKHICKYTDNGSILVFHDSEKAEEKLKFLLPKTLEHFSKLGFIFEVLPQK